MKFISKQKWTRKLLTPTILFGSDDILFVFAFNILLFFFSCYLWNKQKDKRVVCLDTLMTITVENLPEWGVHTAYTLSHKYVTINVWQWRTQCEIVYKRCCFWFFFLWFDKWMDPFGIEKGETIVENKWSLTAILIFFSSFFFVFFFFCIPFIRKTDCFELHGRNNLPSN